ncbi:MAG: ATP-binding protein [Desulfuromonadales bacterium]
MPRLNLHKKLLMAFWVISLAPLVFLAVNSNQSIRKVESILVDNASTALDDQAAKALVLRAQMVASEVSAFLRTAEADLFDLAALPVSATSYLDFYSRHRRQIWYRSGTNANPVEKREIVPLYSELAFIDAQGRETLRIAAGEVSPILRDVSRPENTTYLSETYFSEARHLPVGQVYVSRLTGWHVNKEDQLQGQPTPESAVEGRSYQGVIRLSTPLRKENGDLLGVVVLSLDHRHLMEFTQHIIPTEEHYVVFPSYDSGNYAFMFDDEGWMITHPKYWDIRGLDNRGRLVPPYTVESSPEAVEKGVIPYNLLFAGFVHPNYPVAAAEVFSGRSGVVDVTNVGGSQKIMAYAPIFYDRGVYADKGVFGGVTIGAELANFHRPALMASESIRREISRFTRHSGLLITVTGLVVVLAAYLLSRSIGRPLLQLTEGTKEMARGNLDARVTVQSHDEVGELAESFNTMANELRRRHEKLVKTLADLRSSRYEILRERNFKETIVENIETGILTLDPEGRVTSANSPVLRILNLERTPSPIPLEQSLEAWPEIWEALAKPLAESLSGFWSRYFYLEREGKHQTFRIALLPVAFSGEKGRIVTVEDLTERTNMRRRMERMERLASLGRLSAGIAHEIRNPLTGVSLLLDELHDRLLRFPEDQNLIRRALEEMERLEGLVNELLNFSVPSQPSLTRVDVADVLRETLFLCQKQLQKADIVLQEEIATNRPLVPLDFPKMKQAFLNLVTNAIQAMPQGGILRVLVGFGEEQVTISFVDTGQGIAPDLIPLIFEPFYTNKGGGTGLGLSITHNIVSDHGGRIEVESHPGAGSTFTIWLPLHPEERAGHDN